MFVGMRDVILAATESTATESDRIFAAAVLCIVMGAIPLGMGIIAKIIDRNRQEDQP